MRWTLLKYLHPRSKRNYNRSLARSTLIMVNNSGLIVRTLAKHHLNKAVDLEAIECNQETTV